MLKDDHAAAESVALGTPPALPLRIHRGPTYEQDNGEEISYVDLCDTSFKDKWRQAQLVNLNKLVSSKIGRMNKEKLNPIHDPKPNPTRTDPEP